MAYIPKKRTPVKNRLEAKLLQYLSDPSNPPLTRLELAKKVLGYKDTSSMYVHFTGGDLTEIENRALQIRRTRYAKPLMKVDSGILAEGAKGVPGAAKLCYQRFEDWSEKKTIQGVITFENVLKKIAGDGSGGVDGAGGVIDVTPDSSEIPE